MAGERLVPTRHCSRRWHRRDAAHAYTAQSLNVRTGRHRDPYHLWDNINLGATYLSFLWHNFHGNMVKVVSGYNEGGWAVIHRGIFNWRYVNSVLYLMRKFR